MPSSRYKSKVKGSGFAEKSDEQHIDSIRRMLAMVEDVRAVVIKMAERIVHCNRLKKPTKKPALWWPAALASAPLANRLGIGQLKWGLKTLRSYLHPITYKQTLISLTAAQSVPSIETI